MSCRRARGCRPRPQYAAQVAVLEDARRIQRGARSLELVPAWIPPPQLAALQRVQLAPVGASVQPQEQVLAQVEEQNPDLSDASGDYVEEVMRINPPVDPLFRVGEIGLGYDKDRDLVVLFVKELLTEEDDQETAAVVRFWASRTQVRMLARWGVEVVSRGRPVCSQCGQPEEPEGHFCPKKNGYKH